MKDSNKQIRGGKPFEVQQCVEKAGTVKKGVANAGVAYVVLTPDSFRKPIEAQPTTGKPQENPVHAKGSAVVVPGSSTEYTGQIY